MMGLLVAILNIVGIAKPRQRLAAGRAEIATELAGPSTECGSTL
jgi:hypothetical protein